MRSVYVRDRVHDYLVQEEPITTRSIFWQKYLEVSEEGQLVLVRSNILF